MIAISGHDSTDELHICTSTQEGDWIIFRCPRCELYERRLNWRTKEMQVFNDSIEIRHKGFHYPQDLVASVLN